MAPDADEAVFIGGIHFQSSFRPLPNYRGFPVDRFQEIFAPRLQEPLVESVVEERRERNLLWSRLPLDLQAELHLRSDRASVTYRQWLGKMGLTFGTA